MKVTTKHQQRTESEMGMHTIFILVLKFAMNINDGEIFEFSRIIAVDFVSGILKEYFF